MRRVFVCKQHVTQGLKVTDTPHVQKVSLETKYNCIFCHQKAQFKLFYDRSIKQKEAILN